MSAPTDLLPYEVNELRIKELEGRGYVRLLVCECCWFQMCADGCGCADSGRECNSGEERARNWARWQLAPGGYEEYENDGYHHASCEGCELNPCGLRYEVWAYELPRVA